MNETRNQYVAVTDVERLLREDKMVILIDARTAEEFAEGHVAGAINAPIPGLAGYFRNRDNTVGELLITMCGSTGRGEKAASILTAQGVQNVMVMKGGLKSWKDAGFRVEM